MRGSGQRGAGQNAPTGLLDCQGRPQKVGHVYRIERPKGMGLPTIYHGANCPGHDKPPFQWTPVLVMALLAAVLLLGVAVGAKVTWGTVHAVQNLHPVAGSPCDRGGDKEQP